MPCCHCRHVRCDHLFLGRGTSFQKPAQIRFKELGSESSSMLRHSGTSNRKMTCTQVLCSSSNSDCPQVHTFCVCFQVLKQHYDLSFKSSHPAFHSSSVYCCGRTPRPVERGGTACTCFGGRQRDITYICICICVFIYIHIYPYMCADACTHMYIHKQTPLYICIYIHT